MTCIRNIYYPDPFQLPNGAVVISEWYDSATGAPCSPVQQPPTGGGGIGGGGGILGGSGGGIASPSTVWTGTGVYSRTLQALLSSIAMLRNQQQVPTATQLITAPGGGGYGGGYGGVPAYVPPTSNFAGSLQRTIERYPGTVAIVGAVGAALVIGKLAGGSKRPRYA